MRTGLRRPLTRSLTFVPPTSTTRVFILRGLVRQRRATESSRARLSFHGRITFAARRTDSHWSVAMADKKIIAVVGATGAQGGGVARAILADKNSEFAVRPITRDASSEAAKAFRTEGAEVVEA